MGLDHGNSYGASRQDLLTRLKRIEGQVRGVQKMLEEDRYCVDVLVQLSAIKSAVHQVALSILEAHTRGCVADALMASNQADEKITELIDILRQFAKG